MNIAEAELFSVYRRLSWALEHLEKGNVEDAKTLLDTATTRLAELLQESRTASPTDDSAGKDHE